MKLSDDTAKEIVKSVNFKEGLIPAVVQEFQEENVLMVAFMSPEALRMTLTSGMMHFWSRSREKIWKKGEESGNTQEVKRVRVDCDKDTLLFDVEPEGPACHKGYDSCFYLEVDEEGFSKILEKNFDPSEVY